MLPCISPEASILFSPQSFCSCGNRWILQSKMGGFFIRHLASAQSRRRARRPPQRPPCRPSLGMVKKSGYHGFVASLPDYPGLLTQPILQRICLKRNTLTEKYIYLILWELRPDTDYLLIQWQNFVIMVCLLMNCITGDLRTDSD